MKVCWLFLLLTFLANGTGAGASGPRVKHYDDFSRETIIYQAEMYSPSASSSTLTGIAGQAAAKLHRSEPVCYPPAKCLPLPQNLADFVSSERARFSPLRTRDITGLLLDEACAVTDSSDSRIMSYDCSGSVSLSAHMQTNVPSPCNVEGSYTHFNMPGGLWGLHDKYTAADHLVHSTFIRRYSTNADDGSGQKKLSRKEQLKAAVKDYGSVVIVFHVCISLVSLGVCYIAVTSGIDLQAITSRWAPNEGTQAAAAAAPFVVAYAVHKVFAPVRITITLVSVPFIVKYLRRVGFIKGPKPRGN